MGDPIGLRHTDKIHSGCLAKLYGRLVLKSSYINFAPVAAGKGKVAIVYFKTQTVRLKLASIYGSWRKVTKEKLSRY